MLDDLIGTQCGVVTRRQAATCGLSDAAVAAHLAAGRWQRVRSGTYATFTGPLPRHSILWAALLTCGRDAVLSHESAAELHGLTAPAGPVVHVSVPATRRVAAGAGLRIHRRTRMPAARGQLPRTTIEETVVDLTQSAPDLDRAMGWIARACANRLTTAARLAASFAARPRLRWRHELAATVADVGTGCHSLLELRYLRSVERAHRLPAGRRQTRDGAMYRDVRYDDDLVVELDGRIGHIGDHAFRDLRRDNAAQAAGFTTLRYGWADVTRRPCAVAVQVATVLRHNGWTGEPQRCGPTCTLGRS